MSFVAVAVGGAAIVGGVISSQGAQSAAQTQANASMNAQQISQNEFNTITAQNAPYMQSGYGALSALDYGLGISPQTATGGVPGQPATSTAGPNGYDPQSGYQIGPGGSISQGLTYGSPNGMSIGQMPPQPGQPGASPVQGQPGQPGQPGQAGPTGQTGGLGFGSLTQPFNASNWQQLSPAYNFQLQQGQQNVLNSDASGQGALSGSALKDLTNYNQSAANTSFNNAFNQYQTQQGNIFSRLSAIAQLGQASANNTGQQGTALAGQAAQSATNIGTAQAGGIVGSANAISGGLSSAAPWLAYGGGSNPNSSAANWDTENPGNFQDFASSDRRLKTDIHLIGKLASGLNVYTFRYSASPEMVHMGVMADEVQPLIPDAVTTDDQGFLRVNYGMLR